MSNLRELVEEVVAFLEDSPAEGEAMLDVLQKELRSLAVDPRWKQGDMQRWQEAVDALRQARDEGLPALRRARRLAERAA